MANTGFLSVSDLSFDGIKSNLKTFVQSKTQFKDYDFEGSNLNALLDILSYNTYMNSYYLNMVGSEMFLDSAQMRPSIISHAKELNYVPRSATSARAQVTFTVNTGGNLPPFVIVPKGYIVRTSVDNISLDFSTTEDTIILNNNGVYTSSPVNVYEGKQASEYFNVVNTGTNSFVLSSETLDTNSIEVHVINSSLDSTSTQFTKVNTLYGLTSESKIFFVSGYGSYQYLIQFGDGILGKALTAGNIVKVTYRSTNGSVGNKAYSFSPTNKINGLYAVTVSTNIIAVDGSDIESNESIKYNAPRHFATQDRAVTKQDYVNLITENYPEIKTINVYGGEEADPPLYGSVIISAIPYGTAPLLSTEIKNDIITFLKEKNITITPVIVDPEYLYVEIVSAVQFDPTQTLNSVQFIQSQVINQIQMYQTLYLSNFGSDLRKSKLTSMIDQADSSIVSNQTTLRLLYVTTPVKGVSQTNSFSFNNPLNRTNLISYKDSESEIVQTNFFTYYDETLGVFYQAKITDDGVGNLRMYFLSNDSKKIILNSNIGTVDYSTGTLNYTIYPWDYSGSINFYASTLNDDIYTSKNKYLTIDFNNLLITVNVETK